MKKWKIEKYLVCCLIAFLLSQNVFASSTIYSGGREAIIGDGPVSNEIVLAGDSYAQHFLRDEYGKDLIFYEYSAAGTTIGENKDKLLAAFDSFYRMILLSISVNDQVRGTHPSEFEKNYRQLLEKGKETKKIVFVHTYIHYPLASFMNFEFPTYVYDSIVRQLASEYDNVHYIDMSDCEALAFSTGDFIHYSKEFNDILYDRLKAKIDTINFG